MKIEIMTFQNSDGKIIEKEVEERLVSIYKANGWEIKVEKKEEKKPKSFTSGLVK